MSSIQVSRYSDTRYPDSRCPDIRYQTPDIRCQRHDVKVKKKNPKVKNEFQRIRQIEVMVHRTFPETVEYLSDGRVGGTTRNLTEPLKDSTTIDSGDYWYPVHNTFLSPHAFSSNISG